MHKQNQNKQLQGSKEGVMFMFLKEFSRRVLPKVTLSKELKIIEIRAIHYHNDKETINKA